MRALRRYLLGHRAVAALVVLMALAVRLAVPVGFMPAVTSSGVAIVLCPAAGEVPHAAMPGMHHHHETPGKSVSECPFAGLALPSLGGADAVQLAALVLTIFAAGLRPNVGMAPRRIARLRPPLRGPPSRG